MTSGQTSVTDHRTTSSKRKDRAVKILVTVAAFLLLVSGPSQAMKISEYYAKKDNPQQKALIDVYLKGYIHGVFNSNDILETRGEQLLFCMPDQDEFLRKGNYTEFLDIILSRSVTYVKDDTTIEIALISTLVNTYPCKKSKQEKKRK